jgi:hypothetical protein
MKQTPLTMAAELPIRFGVTDSPAMVKEDVPRFVELRWRPVIFRLR